MQQRKLKRLVADAMANVPFYRALYSRLGLTRADLADPRLLQRLPVLSKADLLAVPLEERRNSRYRRDVLTVESSTGSTGQPFPIYVDHGYRIRRNLRFLRALVSAGYRPWRPLMLLTDRLPAQCRRPGRRHYVPVHQSTAAVLEAYRRIRPAMLYGLTTPLRLLGERLLEGSRALPRPRVVVSTAEVLDSATRRTLETAFGCPVIDFYGMTEMGLIASQRIGQAGYLMSSESVLTEFVPHKDDGCYRMLMTNLDLHAAPIIRFDSGDLAFVRDANGTPVVEAFEGRCIDTVICRSGAQISPYRITDAVSGVPGVRRFKITQRSLAEFHVELEADADSREAAVRAIEAIFERLLGSGLVLEFSLTGKLIPDGARKFRPVESRVVRP